MSEFKSSNSAQVCDNCGARHPEVKSCVKFWQDEWSRKSDQLSEAIKKLKEAQKGIEIFNLALHESHLREEKDKDLLAKYSKDRIDKKAKLAIAVEALNAIQSRSGTETCQYLYITEALKKITQ